MKILLRLLCLLLAGGGPALAQTDEIQTCKILRASDPAAALRCLKQAAEREGPTKHETADRLNHCAETALDWGDTTRCAQWLARASRLAHESRSAGVAARTDFLAGRCADTRQRWQEAARHYRRSAEGYVALADEAAAARSYESCGLSLNRLGRSSDAAAVFAKAYRLFAVSESVGGMASVEAGLGNVYLQIDETLKAAGHFRRSVALHDSCRCDSAGLAMSLFNLADLVKSIGDTTQALAYYSRSLAVAEATGNLRVRAFNLAGLGYLRRAQGNGAKSVELLEEAVAAARQASSPELVQVIASMLGVVYVQLGRREKARAARNLSLAHDTGHGDLNYLAPAYANCTDIDSALGEWQAAYLHHRKAVRYKERLIRQENAREVGRLEARHAHEQRIAALEAEDERRNWLLGTAAGGLLLVSGLAGILYRSRRRERRSNQRLRQLNAEIEQQNAEIIAQRDQLESANERLTRLDRMKDELSGMIVHDLKNPLNAVLCMAALPPDPARLMMIRRAGQQMSQLTLNLLDVQKYETDRLHLQLEWLSVAEVLEEVESQTGYLAEPRGIRVERQVPEWLWVRADRDLLVRVWVNLMTNALKNAPSGDALQIAVTFNAAGGAVFRLTDHGRGIAEDVLPTIFEKFAQVDGGRPSGRLRSTGLGLTFCRMAVESHGGTIRAFSEVGRYTTLEFTLPEACLGEPPVEVLSKPVQSAHTPEAAVRPDAPEYLPVLDALRKTLLYDYTSIVRLLEALPDEPPAVLVWKAQLEQAALSGDTASFLKLLGG